MKGGVELTKVDINIVGRPKNTTFNIQGNYIDVVAALSQAMIEVAKSNPDVKELVSSACSIIIDEIND